MRCNSIDDFRGFAVFLMFIANFMVLFANDPPLILNHAQVGTFLPLDLVAPLFGFAMGLCLPFSLARTRAGQDPVYGRLVRRVALLFLIGWLPNIYYRLDPDTALWHTALSTWGILETWALGYLLAFLFCYLRLEFRLPLALGLALVYQLFLLELPFISSKVFSLTEGGPVAVLSWAIIIVTGTVYGELMQRSSGQPLLGRGLGLAVALLAVGLLAHFTLAPLDRISVSASYTIFGTGFAALVFLFFHFRAPQWGVLFREVGKYPLLAWVLQVLIYGPVFHTVGLAYFDWAVGGVLAVLSVVLLFLATSLVRRAGVQIKL